MSQAPARGFASILFGERGTPRDLDERPAPDCFRDLNLDQVVEAITSSRPDYRLVPFFCEPLAEADLIAYRQEVLRGLERKEVRACIDGFAKGMVTMRAHLQRADEAHYRPQREAWLLQAAGAYCEAVERFSETLAAADVEADGLRSFREFLRDFAAGTAFKTQAAERERIQRELDEVDYTIEISGDRVRVDNFEEQADYSAEIHETFERFRQGSVENYRFRYGFGEEMDHVEVQILELVGKLNPQIFGDLAAFCENNRDFPDPSLIRFDREVQFYLAYLDYIERFEAPGLHFTYPEICQDSKELRSVESFDLALAGKLLDEGTEIVTNDWELRGAERIFVVSGPNQGGKTTFARAFGQLHYLARLGLRVPGREAQLFLSDEIFTHFERQEDHSNLSGKLEDDLLRVRGILERATPRSVVVMNESFSSTALEDARMLGRRVLEKISALDLLCVYVTFVEELASLNEKTVSLTGTVDPDDPATRTFKVVRRPADGRAYAIAIAEKYRLTFDELKERIGS